MDFVMTISKAYDCSPFDVLKEDTCNVIKIINYFLDKEDYETVEEKSTDKGDEVYYTKDGTKVKRKKVTNATATWW